MGSVLARTADGRTDYIRRALSIRNLAAAMAGDLATGETSFYRSDDSGGQPGTYVTQNGNL
jgi:hypothetical protein